MTSVIKTHIFSEYNLKDYILDDEHIQKSLRLKINKTDKNQYRKEEVKIKEKEEVKINNFFIPLQQDTLFWSYFIIANGDTAYEMLHTKNSLVTKQLKIGLVSLIRKNKDLLKIYKFDTITNIESNLANDIFLNIKTFMALCVIVNINIIYIKKNTYFENLMNDTSDVYVVREDICESKYTKKYGFHLASKEYIDNIRTTFYKLDKIEKVIKAISSYKVEELVQICKKLAIEYSNNSGKTKSKKDLYEAIIQYF